MIKYLEIVKTFYSEMKEIKNVIVIIMQVHLALMYFSQNILRKVDKTKYTNYGIKR